MAEVKEKTETTETTTTVEKSTPQPEPKVERTVETKETQTVDPNGAPVDGTIQTSDN